MDKGVPAIVPELGGHGHFQEEAVATAHRGLKNLLKDLGIIEGEVELPRRQVKLRWKADPKAYVAHCNRGGVFIPTVSLGDLVGEGEELGFIYSPRSFEVLKTVRAPQAGYVFTIRENPVVHPGEPLVSVPEVIEWLQN